MENRALTFSVPDHLTVYNAIFFFFMQFYHKKNTFHKVPQSYMKPICAVILNFTFVLLLCSRQDFFFLKLSENSVLIYSWSCFSCTPQKDIRRNVQSIFPLKREVN